jgi:hypothetical protein
MEALQAILERALAVTGNARSVERKLNFQIMALRDSPETALSELRELLSVIEGTEPLHIFGNSGNEGFHSLIYWLISRSQQVGTEQATEDLAWYLSESPRILRRLKSLRGLSHEQVKQVFTRSP